MLLDWANKFDQRYNSANVSRPFFDYLGVEHGGALLLTEAGLSGSEIVRRYQRRIYAVLHRMAGRAEVEDLCQETFLQILRNPDGLRAARDPDAWVYRIAMNVAVDALRRKARDRRLPERAPTSPAPGGESEAALALERLEPHLKQVIILRVFEELSHEKISAILDTPVGTIRWRLFEARKKLAEVLSPQLKNMKEST
jgi:RNA polymerase sigma-70 factor, ECF subfamily